jgi:hypothetical protein
MTANYLLMALALGTAVLALWSYVRWPGAAPATMKGALLRMLIALVLLPVGGNVLDIGIEAIPSMAVLVLVLAVVPVLTFAFLASIWFLKVCVDQVRGAV